MTSLPKRLGEPERDWEIILPDYTNIRGFNYIPTYPSVPNNPFTTPIAVWRYYAPKDIDQQLGYLRGVGINAIRVWLSYYVWEHDERIRRQLGGSNAFIDKFCDFLGLAANHRIYVMPVLWDDQGVEPSENPYEEPQHWTRAPRGANVTVEWMTDPSNPFNGDAYLKSVVGTGRDSKAIFMWDIMNEPQLQEGFFRHNCDRVRELDPNPDHKITIGYAVTGPKSVSPILFPPVLDHPTLDVLSFHPYGSFRQNVHAWTSLARRVSKPPFTDRPKQLLATEGGGDITLYQDFVGYCREADIGWMPFMALTGPDVVFAGQGGILYRDGEARSKAAIDALQAFARDQGVLYTQLDDILQKKGQEPSFNFEPGTEFPPPTFPVGFGTSQIIHDLHPARWPSRPKLSNETFTTPPYGYVYLVAIFRRFNESLGFLTEYFEPPVLTAAEEEIRQRFFAVAWERIFSNQAVPWLLTNPLRIDWERYDQFFTDWGIALWKMITRHGLGGPESSLSLI